MTPTRVHKRAAIIRAALELFGERGYEGTTADDIAARAGVARRTFFNYFPSKADLLFEVDEPGLERIADAIAAQHPDLDALAAIEAGWLESTDSTFGIPGIGNTQSESERVRDLMHAAGTSPTLRGKQFEVHLACERANALGLARRDGVHRPTLEMRVAAAMAQAVISHAMVEWVRAPDRRRDDVLREAFAAARAAASPPPG